MLLRRNSGKNTQFLYRLLISTARSEQEIKIEDIVDYFYTFRIIEFSALINGEIRKRLLPWLKIMKTISLVPS